MTSTVPHTASQSSVRTGFRAAHPIYVVDMEQRVIAWDPGPTDGIVPPSDVTGLPCYEVLPSLNPRNARQCRPNCHVIAMARAGQAAPDFTVWGIEQDGASLPVDISILLHDGGPGGHPTVTHLARFGTDRRDAGRPARTGDHDAGGDPGGDHGRLTRRQLQALQLLAEGRSPGEIAGILRVRPITVRNHLQGAMDRLNARTRIEAIAAAVRLGLL